MKKRKSPQSTVPSPQSETATAAPVADQPLHAGPGEFKIVPWDSVRPDPDQPRKSFDPAKLEELAESIRLNGILSPLVVQLKAPTVKIEEPNLYHDDWQAIDTAGAVVAAGKEEMVRALVGKDAEDFYQIVFGERRWRAAGLAGLNMIPVIVRELTEREVFVHQFVENQARENLSALEEAKSFASQIAKRKESEPAFNADKLAEELGISRATVYNRLTLTRLTEPVLAALTGGTIQPTQAGLIAMIPDPKQQEKLLKKICDENDWHFPYSFRDIEELIEDEYCKQLKDAPFDLKTDFHSDRGEHLGTCEACIHRTGNMKEAFPHIKNGNVCTRTECFAQKCKIHFSDEAAAAERKGQKVMTKKEFKAVKADYVAADAYDYNLGGYTNWGDLMGKKAPEPALVITEEGLKKVYPKEQAIDAAKRNGSKLKSEEAIAKQQAESKESAKRRESRRALVLECAPELLRSITKIKDSEALLLASEMIQTLNWPNEDLEEALMDKCKGKSFVLARCFADSESEPVTHIGEWHKENVALWKRAGVDLIEEEKKREKEAAPALPLAKAKPQQKELLVVKKNKKKGRK
jgi:ParB/RepB/Spo0J family partition protein